MITPAEAHTRTVELRNTARVMEFTGFAGYTVLLLILGVAFGFGAVWIALFLTAASVLTFVARTMRQRYTAMLRALETTHPELTEPKERVDVRL